MISALHLIWIVPLVSFIGFITGALLAGGKERPTPPSEKWRGGGGL